MRLSRYREPKRRRSGYTPLAFPCAVWYLHGPFQYLDDNTLAFSHPSAEKKAVALDLADRFAFRNDCCCRFSSDAF